MLSDDFVILVVDADEPSVTRVRVALERHGYASRAVGDGHAALRAIADQCPAMVLIGVEMAPPSGFELIASLQALDDPQLRRIPVVVMAGLNVPGGASVPGTAGTIRKPIDERELLDAVRLVRARAESARRARAASAGLARRDDGTSPNGA